VWIADDGYINKTGSQFKIEFYTNGFIYEDVLFLKILLEEFTKEIFYINKSSVGLKNKDNKNFIIVGTSSAALKVLEIIKPYLIEMGMERKIPNIEINTKTYNIKYNLLLLIKENPGSKSSFIIDQKIGYNNVEWLKHVLNKMKLDGLIHVKTLYNHNNIKYYTYYITNKGECQLINGMSYNRHFSNNIKLSRKYKYNY